MRLRYQNQSGYVNETNHSLFDWRAVGDPGVLNDYSRAGRFFQYFGDQFGAGLLMPIVASSLHGIAGLDAGLAAMVLPGGSPISSRTGWWPIFSTMPPWILALATCIPISRKPPDHICQPERAAHLRHGQRPGSRVPLPSRAGRISASPLLRRVPNLVIKAVEIGAPSRVLDVTPGVEFHEPGLVRRTPKIHFVVMNTSQNNSPTY